jgi:trans-2,3-dihydro-3-hydroxyanthranilate isomerase
MPNMRYVICDVFTNEPLKGNALAVFTDATGLSDRVMQRLARELNLSESVFVCRAEQGGHARIRIFTPVREIPFAGHPTLGAATVLGLPMQLQEIRLETGAGIVPVVFERREGKAAFGWMTQPVPKVIPFLDNDRLFAALGVSGSVLPVALYDLGIRHLFVALASRDEVAHLRPNLLALSSIDAGVNVFSGEGNRYKTRMFAPSYGVNEDPATGSAAGPLAVHLARHGRIGFGEEITIEQGEEVNRPSLLYARVYGSADRIETVQVGGHTVIVARGEFQSLRESETAT